MSEDDLYTGFKHPICAAICVEPAREAIDFYIAAFGAKLTMEPIIMDDGKVGHAELSFGGATIMLADEFPGMNSSPKTLGGSPVSFVFAVDDVDQAFSRALKAGCEEVRPIEDQFYGDRTGSVKDPFGYTWRLSQHIADLSNAEIDRRAKELFGDNTQA